MVLVVLGEIMDDMKLWMKVGTKINRIFNRNFFQKGYEHTRFVIIPQ